MLGNSISAWSECNRIAWEPLTRPADGSTSMSSMSYHSGYDMAGYDGMNGDFRPFLLFHGLVFTQQHGEAFQ